VNAAVTGATGFVGGHLVEALRRRGDSVACLVRTASRAAALRELGCSVVEGCLADARALERMVEGCEAVFHVAGTLAGRSDADFLPVNRDATERLAGVCQQLGVRRFLYVSSLAVTGPAERGRPVDESTTPRPLTPYGRSKRAGEDAVRASGVRFTIVRPPVVYGPRDRQLLRLFRLARHRLMPVLGDGRQELSLVHAADLADALVAATASPRAEGGTYHAAHPAVVTQEELARAVARAVGTRARTIRLPGPVVPPLLFLTGAAARLAGRDPVLSPNKAAELLAPAWTCSSGSLARDAGWRARIALDVGLTETARWYTAAGWL
jgi:nucleoside-diphosphate-sugar epimerase